jgi:hypothetical protein
VSVSIAVVGAGIFGVASAVRLAERDHPVTLFEAAGDILSGASGINQYRLHRGYHYPRSIETAIASRDSEASFRAAYGAAIIDNPEHYYAVAGRDSLTSGEAFQSFLNRLGLAHREAAPPFLRPEAVELCVTVEESLFDSVVLRQLAWEQLRESTVEVRLGRRVRLSELGDFDVVVVAAYSAMNSVLEGLGDRPHYQFEVVEKPVVRAPPALAGRSVVILDGPFLCMDPHGSSGLSVMGHVVHAIHHTNVGPLPVVPETIEPLLNQGVIERPATTNFPRFVEAATHFLPDAAEIEHVGSMFTIRAVLPGLDATDARPTLVTRVDERVIVVFSGKIGTCVRAADEVADLIEVGRPPEPL